MVPAGLQSAAEEHGRDGRRGPRRQQAAGREDRCLQHRVPFLLSHRGPLWQALVARLEEKKYSKHEQTQLFLAVLRMLGYRARYVVNIEPCR